MGHERNDDREGSICGRPGSFTEVNMYIVPGGYGEHCTLSPMVTESIIGICGPRKAGPVEE